MMGQVIVENYDCELDFPDLRYFALRDPDAAVEKWVREAEVLIEEVLAEAQGVYETDGVEGLRTEQQLIGEHVEEKRQKWHRAMGTAAAYERIVQILARVLPVGVEPLAELERIVGSELSVESVYRYSLETRLTEDLEIIGRDGKATDHEAGVQYSPDAPLGLRRRELPFGYWLWPTAEAELPSNSGAYPEDFGVAVAPDATWREAAERACDKVEKWHERGFEANKEAAYLEARLTVYDDLLERRASGEAMPWANIEETEEAYPTVRACVEAVVAAAEKVDRLYRQRLLKWAASELDVRGSPPYKKVKEKLREADLYAVGDGPGRPGKKRARELARETLEQCRAWLQAETKGETRC